MPFFKYVILIVCSYFFGNISNARIISKLLKSDITKKGSGNPGTMNMLRSYGFKAGIITLALDALKGAIPALIGYFVFGGMYTDYAYMGLYIAGLSVIVGHNFPVLYKFKGGKGVACILGVFAVAEPLWAVVMFVVCFFYLLVFDYGAVASFIFITVLTVVEAIRFKYNTAITVLLAIIFFMTWFMHRKNILRMLSGTENKVNLKKSLKKLAKKNYKEKSKEIKREYKGQAKTIKEEYKEVVKEQKNEKNENVKQIITDKKKEIKRDVKEQKKEIKNEYKEQIKELKIDYKTIIGNSKIEKERDIS